MPSALGADAETAAAGLLAYTVADLGYFQARELDERPSLNRAARIAAWQVINQTRVVAALLDEGASTSISGLPESANSFAFGMNDRGGIVGIVESPSDLRDTRAFSYEHGLLQILPSLGGKAAAARSVNQAGLIVGNAQTATRQVHAASWKKGAVHDLGTLRGGNFSRAFAVNEHAAIVGEANTSLDGKSRAVIWSDDRIHSLGLLPGGSFSSAQAISNTGIAVGYADDARGETQAVRFENDRVQSLGTLGDQPSSALDINDAEEIVGASTTADGMMRAFLWTAGHMYSLNQLILLRSEWVLLGAYRINADGQILAYGFYQGRMHLCLLTPMHGPPSHGNTSSPR